MNRRKLIFISGFLLIFIFQLSSQVPFTDKELGSEFNRAMELYNKEKYVAAIRLFDSYVNNQKDKSSINVADAEYYSAISAMNLFNPDAEYRMMTFIARYPENPRLNEARLYLGDYFYQNKNYRKAVSYYETVNRQHLEKEKLPEYFFRYGYSLYSKGDQSKALLMFSEIKDIDTEYTPPALYYFSQIAYEQKMYQTAMEGFMKLMKHSVRLYHSILFRFFIFRRIMTGYWKWHLNYLNLPERREVLNSTGLSAMHTITRENTKMHLHIWKNIQREQSQVTGLINTSSATAIIKQEILTRL